ncbi:MAG: cytochrome c oxidase subunit II [Acidobacteria bacterium]|nr:cytochrome c oxidase subunit II [Acidobacteriota bacterium]
MILALTIWVITLVTTALFIGRYWWFPAVASAHGPALDQQFMLTLVVTGLVFILAQLGLGYLIVHFRDRPGRHVRYSHGSNKLEILWTLATTVLFFSVVLAGQDIWASLNLQNAPAGSLQIEITGQQFQWNVRYPGADGKFGKTSNTLINDSAGNFVGLDERDAAAQDDVVVPTMAVPVNRPVELLLRSKDVTHSFFVRELRIKQDAVPGMTVPIHFTATKLGTYEIACAELCGLGHHRMRSVIEVLSEADYHNWLKERSD